MQSITPISAFALATFGALSTAIAVSFEIPEAEIFSITNVDSVLNGPTAATEFTLGSTRTISRVRTYHWNNGAGATPGMIWLLDDQGGVAYGPWPATGSPGQGDAPNAYWDAAPDIEIAPGIYRVMDSDPATWAHNAATGGRGMTWVDAASEIITVPDPPSLADLGIDDSIASIVWNLDGDLRESQTVWVPAASAEIVEATLEIPTAALSQGVHHVTLAPAGATDGNPNSFGFPHHFVFVRFTAPATGLEITALRWSVGGDPRTGGTSQAAASPGLTIEETIMIPTSELEPGAHTFSLVASDALGSQGHVFASPFLLTSPATSRSISALEARVIDGTGQLVAGPLKKPLAGDPTVYDGTFEWPSFRLRSSGDYQILIAPLSEGGIPGRFALADFAQSVPAYAEAIYADFWPPESYPAEALSFVGDANGDGVINGLAFALGISLSAPAKPAQLPLFELESDSYLFTFRQRSGGSGVPGAGYLADDISYYVELSNHLGAGSWDNDATRIHLEGTPTDNGDGTETVSIRVDKGSAERDFVRLRVTPDS